MQEYPEFDVTSPIGGSPLEDFNIETEYVADPLLADNTYKGIITKVELLPDTMVIKFTVSFQGNDGMTCSDGITPVDGKQSTYTLWLPKKGDDLIKSSFSSLTKRQEAIRGIKRFSDSMKISIGTAKDISEAIQDQKWLSIPVFAKVKSRAVDGKIYNQIKKLERQIG